MANLPTPTQEPAKPRQYNPFLPPISPQAPLAPPNPFVPQAQGGAPLPAPNPGILPPALTQVRDNILNYMHSLGTSMEGLDPVIPQGTPWGGLQRTGGQILDLITMPMREALKAPKNIQNIARGPLAEDIKAFGDSVSSFIGSKYVDPRTQPLQAAPPLPAAAPTIPGMSGAGSAGGIGMAFPKLDGVQNFPGMPLPQAPGTRQIPEYAPDFSSADARLAAAQPKPHGPKETKLQAFLEGLGQGAAAIDPWNDTWSSALAKALGGGTMGMRDLRQRQEDAEIKNEAEMRQYELMRAGVDERRAIAEVTAQMERTKLEIAADQQAFENKWKVAAALQPNIQANNDGSLIVTTQNPKGGVSVQRIGFEDALKNRIAIAQAEHIGGKSAGVAARYRLLNQSGGPWLRLADGVTELLSNQQDSMLFPPGSPAYDMYLEGIAKDDKSFIAQGMTGKALETKMQEARFQRAMQLLGSNPEVLKHGLYVMFGIEPELAPQKPSPVSAPKVNFTQGSPFLGAN